MKADETSVDLPHDLVLSEPELRSFFFEAKTTAAKESLSQADKINELGRFSHHNKAMDTMTGYVIGTLRIFDRDRIPHSHSKWKMVTVNVREFSFAVIVGGVGGGSDCQVCL